MNQPVYQRSSRFVARRFDGELLLVPVSASAADMDSIFILNPVASLIWESLNETPFEEIVARVQVEFDVPPEQAAHDAHAFLAELIELQAAVSPAEPRS